MKQGVVHDSPFHALLNTSNEYELNHIFDGIKDNITVADLNYIEKEGPHQNKSIFWLLSHLAANGNSAPFMYLWNKFKEEDISFDLFWKKASPANDEEACNAIWLLAVAAGEENQPKPFMKVWNKFKLNFRERKHWFLNDQERETGEHSGKPPIYFFAKAAANGNPIFMQIYDAFFKGFILQELYRPAPAGRDEGTSAYYFIARGAALGNLRLLEIPPPIIPYPKGCDNGVCLVTHAVAKYGLKKYAKLWGSLATYLEVDTLLPNYLMKFDKDIPSTLWLLARAIIKENEHLPFLNAWKKFNDKIPLEVILEPCLAGEDKGKSILWLLAQAAANKRNFELFKLVWDKIKDQIPLSGLLEQAQNGDDAGISVLGLLWSINRDFTFANEVLTKFRDEIPLDALLVRRRGAYSPPPVLVQMSRPETVSHFNFFLTRFNDQMTLEILCTRYRDGDKAITLLDCLARFASEGRTDGFTQVWEKFGDQITHLTLINAPFQQSIFSLTAMGIDKRTPEAFIRIWKRFSQELSLKDLLEQVTVGDKVKILCPLWYLANGVLQLEDIELGIILQEILTKKAGFIPEYILDNTIDGQAGLSLREILERLEPNNNLVNLVSARNNFLKALDELPVTDNRLFDLAKLAFDAGYINAYRDLGAHFEAKKEYKRVYQAHVLIPPSNPDYPKIYPACMEHFFAEAMENDSPILINKALEYPLALALKANVAIRGDFIQRIASFYIRGTKSLGKENLVPDHLLQIMHDDTPVEWCFRCFDDIKRRLQHEAENKELKEKVKDKVDSIEALEPAMRALTLNFDRSRSSSASDDKKNVSSPSKNNI